MKLPSFFTFFYRHSPKILFFSGLLFQACQPPLLQVQTEFFSKKNLASQRVGTPDPIKDLCLTGQRLVINWNFPKNWSPDLEPILHLNMRFKKQQEETNYFLIHKRKGYCFYELTQQAYQEKGEIISYQVKIMDGNDLLCDWRHPLWSQLITLEEEEE